MQIGKTASPYAGQVQQKAKPQKEQKPKEAIARPESKVERDKPPEPKKPVARAPKGKLDIYA